MQNILVFAGTTEGRLLIETLCNYNVQIFACVATDYGKELLPQNKQIVIHAQRMDSLQMEDYISTHQINCVVDATHPYAVEVTQNIQSACNKTNTSYLRLLRESSENQNCIYVSSTQEAISYLNQTTGAVLLTTGSKELAAYTAVANFKERLYARVLPMPTVVEQCTSLGFGGNHLICMQGPFSTELNIAMLKQIDASYLVTKESGSNGGFAEKLSAAEQVGATTIVIGRPTNETGLTLPTLMDKLTQHFSLQKKEAAYTPYFPFFYNIKGKHILVVGGGKIAERRIQTLLPFECNITVVAPTCTQQVMQFANENSITYFARVYRAKDCFGADYVLAATNSHTVNDAIVADCNVQHIPVNAAHSRKQCDFYFPAVIKEDNVVIGVTASGINHKQASKTAEHIRNLKEQMIVKGENHCE